MRPEANAPMPSGKKRKSHVGALLPRRGQPRNVIVITRLLNQALQPRSTTKVAYTATMLACTARIANATIAISVPSTTRSKTPVIFCVSTLEQHRERLSPPAVPSRAFFPCASCLAVHVFVQVNRQR